MKLEISTAAFHEAAVRAQHIASGCTWWVTDAGGWRALVSVNSGAGTAMAQVTIVAQRLERLARELNALAEAYDDNEASQARFLEPLGIAGALMLAGPLLPLSLLGFATAITMSGSFRETGVILERTRTEVGLPARSMDELLVRIPQGTEQVRVDRIESSGATHYVVYISGTRDFSFTATTQPWDLTSGVVGLSSLRDSRPVFERDQSACERAVRAAMADAGVGPGDSVVFVGHSLGGVTAMNIAQSGDFDVTDIVNLGAPVHGSEIPEGTRVTSFEYTNDLIPAVSGVAVATSALTIRSTFTNRGPGAFAPHDLSSYRDLVREADRSSDPMVRERRERILRATAGESVTSRWYHGVRTPAPFGAQ